jgi:lipoate-protein ligase A
VKVVKLEGWHFSVDPVQPGSVNMQRDRQLLDEAEQKAEARSFLRFYRWDLPTVSIGHHQQPERAADVVYCAANHIPVVRRPTGGRAVLHDCELTYAVVSNDGRFFPLDSLDKTYLVIARALQTGLSRLGICSDLAAGRGIVGLTRIDVKHPCFASASRHELLVRGRKIVGSAQRRLKRSFLQHGSIPLQLNLPVMAGALGVSEQLIAASTISVSEATGRIVTFEELAAALKAGFEEVFRAGA